jgi:hypothetical protein
MVFLLDVDIRVLLLLVSCCGRNFVIPSLQAQISFSAPYSQKPADYDLSLIKGLNPF